MADKKIEEKEVHDLPELRYQDSIHEQREFNKKIIPGEGDWLEIGEFIPLIEKFDIKERWKCIERKVDGKEIIVTLKKCNFKTQRLNVHKVAEKIMDKHKDILTHSLLRALVHGASKNDDTIEMYLNRIKSKNRDEYKKTEELRLTKNHLEKLKKKRAAMDKNIKIMEDEING